MKKGDVLYGNFFMNGDSLTPFRDSSDDERFTYESLQEAKDAIEEYSESIEDDIEDVYICKITPLIEVIPARVIPVNFKKI